MCGALAKFKGHSIGFVGRSLVIRAVIAEVSSGLADGFERTDACADEGPALCIGVGHRGRLCIGAGTLVLDYGTAGLELDVVVERLVVELRSRGVERGLWGKHTLGGEELEAVATVVIGPNTHTCRVVDRTVVHAVLTGIAHADDFHVVATGVEVEGFSRSGVRAELETAIVRIACIHFADVLSGLADHDEVILRADELPLELVFVGHGCIQFKFRIG